MDFAETDEQGHLRREVRRIAGKYGRDYFLEKARAGGYTDELWEELGRHGYLGVNIPEAHGGPGLGIYELSVVCEELAAAGCPLLLMLVSPAICGTVIAEFGTDEQKARWLPGLATGETRLAFAITEPDAGSNSHQLGTTARRDGDDWILRGTKYYISGVDECQAMLVVVKTGESGGRGRLSLFIVDTDAEGLDKTLIPMDLVAADRQYTLFFDDVRVPADRLIGAEGNGLVQVFRGLNPERILSAALANGVSQYALQRASTYANEREVWGRPIGTHQGIAHPLAEAKVEVELARLMTQKAAWLHDRDDRAAGEAANMAKYAAAEACLHALDQSIQTHGGNGMSQEYGLASLWGFARTLRIAPVSREMILNFVAHHSLGLPKSY